MDNICSDEWRKCCVGKDSTLRHVMEAIDVSSMQIALITEGDGYLQGIVTDGDVRRAILSGISLENSVKDVMRTNPLVFHARDSKSYVINQMQKRKISQAPLLDDNGRVVNLYLLNELLTKKERSNAVLLMAGGLGTRLRPLTEKIPKPLLKIGNKPILETILISFIESGFSKFYFAVNYKSEMIERYFGNGDRWGVEIYYLREKKRLGTAGALYLLPRDLNEPIIVMNGDLLTKVDFGEFLDYHMSKGAIATMGVREYSWQVPYGVIALDSEKIVSIQEKPVHSSYVNAGMYVLSPEAFRYVSAECFLDMPDLFRELIMAGKQTIAYPIRDYWMDIGQMDDFQRAQNDYDGVFGKNSIWKDNSQI